MLGRFAVLVVCHFLWLAVFLGIDGDTLVIALILAAAMLVITERSYLH